MAERVAEAKDRKDELEPRQGVASLELTHQLELTKEGRVPLPPGYFYFLSRYHFFWRRNRREDFLEN